MNGQNSAVLAVLEKASHDAWKRWRQHLAAGTADSPEGIAAHEEAKLAGAAWLDEVLEREARSRAVAA